MPSDDDPDERARKALIADDSGDEDVDSDDDDDDADIGRCFIDITDITVL